MSASDEELAAPRPLITRTESDLAYWSKAWDVGRAEVEAAIRRHGPSVTAVARALGKPARL